MLPTSKRYLKKAGWSTRASAYFLIGLFLAGVIVIRLISSLIHRHIPSHVVDCAHTHEPELEPDPERAETESVRQREPERAHDDLDEGNTEHTPLLRRIEPRSFKSTPAVLQQSRMQEPVENVRRKEPLRVRLTRQISQFVSGVKPMCDENGPCYGFSQTCGGECTKTLPTRPPTPEDRLSLRRRQSLSFQSGSGLPDVQEGGVFRQDLAQLPRDHPRTISDGAQRMGYADTSSPSQAEADLGEDRLFKAPDAPPSVDSHQQQHHHHVPQNAFLAIGLQTSLAIALHKLPEGFITYATNHASPTLGMTVFIALFIHNISEGFVMALPLYLALHSRWKAMFWSSLLGGVSQPAGAGLAALWIWGSQKANGHGPQTTGPSWGVYGGLFAATAGVMTSVSLQLLSEGLALTHNRGMGVGFTIAGMGLMGLSFALTA